MMKGIIFVMNPVLQGIMVCKKQFFKLGLAATLFLVIICLSGCSTNNTPPQPVPVLHWKTVQATVTDIRCTWRSNRETVYLIEVEYEKETASRTVHSYILNGDELAGEIQKGNLKVGGKCQATLYYKKLNEKIISQWIEL